MELRDYVHLLRTHAWSVLRITVMVTLIAAVLTAMDRPSYAGTAQILVTEQGQRGASGTTLDPGLPGVSEWPERGLETQSRLMELQGVAQRVITQLGLKMSPGALLSRVTATPLGGTNIVALKVEDADPVMAAKTANALADAYVEWTRDLKRSRATEAAKVIEKRLSEEAAKIDAASAALAAGDRSGARADELDAATKSYARLADQLMGLQTDEGLASGSGVVVASASPNRVPVSPNWPRNIGLGLVLGLALGLGNTFVTGIMDDTIRSAEEAAAIYGAPVLGPAPAETSETGDPVLSIVQATDGAEEPYGALRDRLAVLNYNHDFKSLLVVSATDAAGTAVAANLAAVLARSGKKVALLDCDFRSSILDRFFGVSASKGLSDMLVGDDSVMALQASDTDGLLALHAGKMPLNPSELLGSAAMRRLVTGLGSWVDWIILDAPPLRAAADAVAIARWADGVLVVTRSGVTTREAARAGREILDSVEARIIGVVSWEPRALPRGRRQRAAGPQQRPNRGQS